MKGKQVVITGPTSGIGRQIAFELAGMGADLVLACRDIERGRQTAEEITKRTGARKLAVMHVDTSSQSSIREFADRVRARFSRIDVLVNNAAINRGALPRVESIDGVELTFATNVIGYHLLSQQLLDLLQASAPARIVNIASTFADYLDLDDLQFKRRPYDSFRAYAQSKACDRLLTWAWARRLDGSDITVNTMAPELVVETGLFRDAAQDVLAQLRQSCNRTIAQGADTAIWLASSPEVSQKTGRFFLDREEIPCEFRNPEVEERLVNECEKLILAG